MSRPKGNSNVLSINLGTFETAPARRDAYIKAAKAAGHWSVGSWCKAVLDKAAHFKSSAESSGRLVLLVSAIMISARPAMAWDWQQDSQRRDTEDRIERLERNQQGQEERERWDDADRRRYQQEQEQDQERRQAHDRERSLDEEMRRLQNSQ